MVIDMKRLKYTNINYKIYRSNKRQNPKFTRQLYSKYLHLHSVSVIKFVIPLLLNLSEFFCIHDTVYTEGLLIC